MQLEGSCHCGSVRFSVESDHPYPFNVCYCSICRKTAGGNGSVINLGARSSTLQITGEDSISVYRAAIFDPATRTAPLSSAERRFCKMCGSALWLWDPRWPDLVHPHASAIDTELPMPPEHTHLMLASKPSWVVACIRDGDKTFDEYPDESLAAWHERLDLVSK